MKPLRVVHCVPQNTDLPTDLVDRLSLETGVQMCTDHPSLYRFPSLSVFLVFFYFPSSHTH